MENNMPAQIIDGESIAKRITDQVAADVAALKQAGHPPILHAVQANDNAGSRIYVKKQKETCEAVGIAYVLDELPSDSAEAALLAHIEKLNNDSQVTGIILQMPVPDGVNARKLQAAIARHKDAEGMSPANLGHLIYGKAEPGPCTAVGAVELLKQTGVEIQGKDAVVVGHSEIVGKPIANLLLGLNATVAVCHIFTRDLESYVRRADILFVAAGKAQAVWSRYQRESKKNPNLPPPDLSPLIPGAWIKPGAVVIDVAINRIPVGFTDGKPILDDKGKPKMKTVGDVDFEGAKSTAAMITPVPGGVGPMTVAMLLKNTVDCAKMQQ
jgi:methylenetetrahydrofolate dehydrogenase (NADP+) / methenyltetrahydrofolate cyclohydrolase